MPTGNQLAGYCILSRRFHSFIQNDCRNNTRRAKICEHRSATCIEGLKCNNCGTAFPDLRSFKCHNWAYAIEAMVKVIQEMEKAKK